MAEKEKSLFEKLYAINFDGKIEKKNGLSYVSWSACWAEVKKVVPDATFTIYERETQYGPVNYFTDGKTAWVKTGVTLNGIEHIEMLPIMDFRNNSIPLENIKSTDVNKAVQRSLTKACARHGAGLWVYQGEDLPEGEADAKKKREEEKAQFEKTKADIEAKKLAELDAATTVPDTFVNPVTGPNLKKGTVFETEKLPWEV